MSSVRQGVAVIGACVAGLAGGVALWLLVTLGDKPPTARDAETAVGRITGARMASCSAGGEHRFDCVASRGDPCRRVVLVAHPTARGFEVRDTSGRVVTSGLDC